MQNVHGWGIYSSFKFISISQCKIFNTFLNIMDYFVLLKKLNTNVC